MVYYRKYRPQTIGELDSSALRETLTAVLSREDIPHAFLLTGPKGLGKTSTARIIAKVVNCTNKKKGSIEPCNTCDACVSITNGSNMDVLEIDGASNRGIDEIRDLRDKVKLAPSRAKKKVYIIDEVHMLTTEAFNALLKTIEEPPAHVMFLFCTTEPQKVPATILSRCFHVAYSLATEEDLVRSFNRIVEGEKIDITDEALHMIAQLSEGGFRDGTKILEEVATIAGGKKITKELVEEKYKVTSSLYLVVSILESLSEKNTKGSIEIIGKMVEQGIDSKYVISQILEALHEILLGEMGLSQNTKYKIPNIKYSLADIQSLVALFSEAYRETKYAVIPQLPLELAIVAWCQGNEPRPMINDQGEKSFVNNDKLHTMESLLKKEKNLKVQSILRGDKEEVVMKKDEEEKPKNLQEELTDKTTAEQFMENLIYKIRPLNFSVAGVLRGCSVKKLAAAEVVFITSYKFHKEKLDDTKTKEIIEQAIKEITGKSMQVMVELKG